MAIVNEKKSVELGFAEKTDSWRLRSKFFPSKLGGKPAWLALKKLPNSLKCSCGEPLTFILQAYAPVDDHPTAFHRTLFIFGCQPCVDKNKPNSIIVFRSQLGLVNEFYPDIPAVEIEKGSESPSAADFVVLCCVCGCPGLQSCSLCKKRNYCSKQHQLVDWKKAHRFVCTGVKNSDQDNNSSIKKGIVAEKNGVSTPVWEPMDSSTQEIDELAARMIAQGGLNKNDDAMELNDGDLTTMKISWKASSDAVPNRGEISRNPASASDSKGGAVKSKKKKEKPTKDHQHRGVLPEYDIEMESEEIMEEERKEDTQEDLVQYFRGLDKESIAFMEDMGQCKGEDLKEIENISKGLNDKTFKRFKKIVDSYPEQILRYCKGGEPLWVSNQDLPKRVPHCELCKGPRVFEFQVMPHALNMLKNDLLDWGTLAIYTCAKSCDTDEYIKEFVYRQDFSH
ncbi:programmed cell death protein 2-like [Tropilaelaps mercedesae]|uniref:Programmed cell death protein 2-like n=1 Tax=Tropilaelaps mercedesae TaxID=418985 RepID=A0A1V9XSB3_9ACAR|nr:programmed cell death protein 2-like [Tropilaelaps mercedesae]